MAEVIIAPSARLDLYEIWEYAAPVSEARANALVSRISAQFEHLAAFPQLGRTRPELGSDVRSIVVGQHVVVYRLRSDHVEVVRVVHTSRDLDALL